MRDERTKILLENFNFFNYINDKGNLDKEAILNTELNEYDNYRLFEWCNIEKTEEMGVFEDRTQEEAVEVFKLNREELENCKMFKCGNALKHLLSLTKPSRYGEINLPFEHIFIDEDFKIDDKRVFGIKIGKEDNLFSIWAEFMDWAIDTGENKNITKEQAKKIIPHGEDIIYIRYGIFDGENFRSICIPYDFKNLKNLNKRKDKSDEIVTNFVSNLLLFLNEPRVSIYIQSPNNERRIKKGKIPLPSLLRTKIEIGLEEYIEKVYFNGLSHSKLGFSFWVIGHWRRLLSPKFTNKRGQKIWIAPYICGEGLMPPQIFEVKVKQ